MSIEALSIYGEKVNKKGEDSKPIIFSVGEYSIMAVCDGLGGAGSNTVLYDSELRTNAYIASNEVVRLYEQEIIAYLQSNSSFCHITFAKLLRDKIISKYDELKTLYGTSTSRLKSSLIKLYPTTLVSIVYNPSDKGYNLYCLWAGDSRGYILTPETGLEQLTKDDIEVTTESLDSVEGDSPMLNLINGSEDFKINSKWVQSSQSFILIVATDGAFAYYKAPFFFEFELLSTLQDSNSLQDWQEKFERSVKSVTGDDYSMVLQPVGYKNFSSLKSYFSKRHRFLYKKYISKLDDLDKTIEEQKNKLGRLAQNKVVLTDKLWINYKKTYKGNHE